MCCLVEPKPDYTHYLSEHSNMSRDSMITRGQARRRRRSSRKQRNYRDIDNYDTHRGALQDERLRRFEDCVEENYTLRERGSRKRVLLNHHQGKYNSADAAVHLHQETHHPRSHLLASDRHSSYPKYTGDPVKSRRREQHSTDSAAYSQTPSSQTLYSAPPHIKKKNAYNRAPSSVRSMPNPNRTNNTETFTRNRRHPRTQQRVSYTPNSRNVFPKAIEGSIDFDSLGKIMRWEPEKPPFRRPPSISSVTEDSQEDTSSGPQQQTTTSTSAPRTLPRPPPTGRTKEAHHYPRTREKEAPWTKDPEPTQSPQKGTQVLEVIKHYRKLHKTLKLEKNNVANWDRRRVCLWVDEQLGMRKAAENFWNLEISGSTLLTLDHNLKMLIRDESQRELFRRILPVLRLTAYSETDMARWIRTLTGSDDLFQRFLIKRITGLQLLVMPEAQLEKSLSVR